MKILKYSLLALAVLLTIIVAVAAYIVLTFDPNSYKPQLISFVKEEKQRTLTLDGDIKLSFFPKLGIDLGKISLSEENSAQEFAAIDRLRLHLALMPLLRKEVVVDEVRIDKLRAKLIRHSDGTNNYDNLAGGKEEAGAEAKEEKKAAMPFALDVSGVKITDSSFSWQDDQQGRTFSVSKLAVSTGRLGGIAPTDLDLDFRMQGDNPKIDAAVRLTGALALDLKATRSILTKLALEVSGEAAGVTNLQLAVNGDVDADGTAKTLSVDRGSVVVKGQRGADNLNVTLDIPRLRLAPEKVSMEKINLLATVTQPAGKLDVALAIPSLESTPTAFRVETVSLAVNGTQMDNHIKGKIATPASGNFETGRFDLARIDGAFDISNPNSSNKTIHVKLNGAGGIDLRAEKASLDLTTKLDESTITVKAGMDRFAAPHYAFDIAIDRLDADRYLPARQQGTEAQPVKTAGPEKPIDLSAIKTLRADGSLRIGSLKAYNVKATDIRVGIKAADGKMTVSPMDASLYEGAARGAVAISTAEKLHVAVRQDFKGISIGPLMRDALNKDVIEGRGSFSVDVTGRGETVTAIKKTLNGNFKTELRDGAIKGINIPSAIREAKAKLGLLKGEQTQAASAREQTDFAELKAFFTIRNGVASGDLSAKSPLLRLAGTGDIDIGEEKLDYLLKATIVATLEGQAGKELAALKGVTVPVRISGPFSGPSAMLDFNSMLGEAVKQKVEAVTDKVKKRAEETLRQELKGLFR